MEQEELAELRDAFNLIQPRIQEIKTLEARLSSLQQLHAAMEKERFMQLQAAESADPSAPSSASAVVPASASASASASSDPTGTAPPAEKSAAVAYLSATVEELRRVVSSQEEFKQLCVELEGENEYLQTYVSQMLRKETVQGKQISSAYARLASLESELEDQRALNHFLSEQQQASSNWYRSQLSSLVFAVRTAYRSHQEATPPDVAKLLASVEAERTRSPADPSNSNSRGSTVASGLLSPKSKSAAAPTNVRSISFVPKPAADTAHAYVHAGPGTTTTTSYSTSAHVAIGAGGRPRMTPTAQLLAEIQKGLRAEEEQWDAISDTAADLAVEASEDTGTKDMYASASVGLSASPDLRLQPARPLSSAKSTALPPEDNTLNRAPAGSRLQLSSLLLDDDDV